MKQLLLILLILQPFIIKMAAKLGFGFSILNELLSLMVLLAFMIKCVARRSVNSSIFILIAYVGYMVLLAIYRWIVPLSFLQILIYSQFFFYFLYFQTLSKEEKHQAMISFKKIMTVFVLIIAVIAIYEAYDHSTFRRFLGVHSVKRGINYFYLISFFGSGPSLAIFITLFIAVWHYCHYALGIKKRKRDIAVLILAIVIGFLSFSRKETLFIVLFLLFFPYPSRNAMNKWIKRAIFALGAFASMVVYYTAFFKSANARGISSDYVRWKIVAACTEVYSDYFPFGTGPGTFGSRLSLEMQHIYEKYNIEKAILGWDDLGIKGAIYDAFLFTFVTEIGIGSLILFFFFYKLFESWTLLGNNYASFTKNFLLCFILFISFFTPMLTHSFGFIVMIFVACMIYPINIFKFKNFYARKPKTAKIKQIN